MRIGADPNFCQPYPALIARFYLTRDLKAVLGFQHGVQGSGTVREGDEAR